MSFVQFIKSILLDAIKDFNVANLFDVCGYLVGSSRFKPLMKIHPVKFQLINFVHNFIFIHLIFFFLIYAILEI